MSEFTVTAIFEFKEDKLDDFIKFINDPENGIAKTRKAKGFKSVEIYHDKENKNKLIIWQRWEKEEDQAAYIKMRTDEKLFDTLGPWMAQPPQIIKQTKMII